MMITFMTFIMIMIQSGKCSREILVTNKTNKTNIYSYNRIICTYLCVYLKV